MKKIIENKLFPAVVLFVMEISLLVFLYCKGFRITYAPDLENNWDAVSAFAAWGGVFMSFVAIMVAIQIPKKIADRQDKIALFEKRYEIYRILLSCRTSVRVIKKLDESDDPLRYLFTTFSGSPKDCQNFNRKEASFYLLDCCSKLRSAIFSFSEEISSPITEVSISLLCLVNAVSEVDRSKEYNEKKQNFFKIINDLEENGFFNKLNEEIKVI